MTSTRLPWDRPANRFSVAVAELRASGRTVLDLTGSNPTAAGLGPTRGDLLAALDHPDLAAYDPDPRGRLATRRAVAGTYPEGAVDPEQVVLTASTSEGYAHLFRLLCDPGDEVLVPTPSYPLFEYLAALDGVRVRTYPLRYDGAWHLDVGAVRAAAGPRVRALVVVHPNNPTGSFLSRSEVDTVVDVARACGAAVVADEVFADYALEPGPDRAGSLVAERRVPTFVLGGLSKSVAAPQVKLGWIVVAGPLAERGRTLDRLDLIADTYRSAGQPAQLVGAGLVPRGPAIRAPILARLRTGLAALRTGLLGSPAAVLHVEGGWSAILRYPSLRSGEARALGWIREHGLVVHPGYLFDLEGEAHVVVGLLTPPEVLDAALPILRAG
jgi:aspartate/methionine/tyrosine aminotransferase